VQVAALQGYLLKNKTRPRECVDEITAWVIQERETRETLKKQKAEVSPIFLPPTFANYTSTSSLKPKNWQKRKRKPRKRFVTTSIHNCCLTINTV